MRKKRGENLFSIEKEYLTIFNHYAISNECKICCVESIIDRCTAFYFVLYMVTLSDRSIPFLRYLSDYEFMQRRQVHDSYRQINL